MHFDLDGCEPVIAVRLESVDESEELVVDGLCDGAHRAIADEDTIDGAEMGDLCCGAGEECLVADVDLVPGDAFLDQLQAKVDKSSDAFQAEAKPKLQALRDQADQLKKQLDATGNATESTWDSVKSATQKAYDSLKDGFNQSRQWVSDKIAP